MLGEVSDLEKTLYFFCQGVQTQSNTWMAYKRTAQLKRQWLTKKRVMARKQILMSRHWTVVARKDGYSIYIYLEADLARVEVVI